MRRDCVAIYQRREDSAFRDYPGLLKKRERNTTMKTRLPFVAVACAAAGILSVSAFTASADAGVMIDNFTTVASPSPWPVNLTAEGNQTVTESGLNTLGGWRETFISATNIGLPGVDFVDVNIETGTGLFGYASSSTSEGFVSLLYDAGGAGLNADFAQKAAIQMNFEFFDFANSNPLPITAILSDGVNSASHTVSLTSEGAQSAMFTISDFADIALLDLASIHSIKFELDPAVSADFQISSIMTVLPAPGAFALLGLAGLCGTRRRRA